MNYQKDLSDPELIQKLRTLIYYWHNTENWWEEGQKLWQEVAYALNEMIWSDYPLLTENFVVFVDWEGMDVLNGGFEESVPLTKLEMLRSEGLFSVK